MSLDFVTRCVIGRLIPCDHYVCLLGVRVKRRAFLCAAHKVISNLYLVTTKPGRQIKFGK
jgi:hypothetical protein